jgi:hypothetical protein
MVAALVGGVIAVAMPTPASAVPPPSFFCGTPDGAGPGPGLSGPCFVIGDENAEYIGVTPSTVEFWGAQWAQNNSLSGGAAPDSFKGLAQTVTPSGASQGTFVTRTGNSSQPPPTVGSIICVLVADHVTQSGPVISGHFINIVAVLTDPGYGPDPGHAGTGRVIGGAGECQGRV